MTQKQLQGDWEGKAKQWDELQPIHFSFKESTPESAASSRRLQKLSKQPQPERETATSVPR